jgi:NADPH-dependent curcumin reductase CurA
MENRNRQVLLKRRPNGAPTLDDFTIADAPLPDPAEGEVLVRGIYLSLDPYMRGRISGQRPMPGRSRSVRSSKAASSARSRARVIRVLARATMCSAGLAGSSTAPSPARAS